MKRMNAITSLSSRFSVPGAPSTLKRELQHGFTLLELIVAMAMIAILVASLYMCISIGFKSRDAAQRPLEPAQRTANVFTLLSADLEGVLPPTGVFAADFVGNSGSDAVDGSNTSNAAAASSSQSQGLSAAKLNGASSNTLHAPSSDPSAITLLSFYTCSNNPRDDEFGADMRKVEFALETPERATHPALMRHVYTNLSPSKEAIPRDQVLCRNVRSAYLRYYDGTLWMDSWDSKGQGDVLPFAVEITLEMERPDPQVPRSDWDVYKMTRVFRIPCAALAQSTSSSTGTGNSSGSGSSGSTRPGSGSGTGTGGGSGSGTGGGATRPGGSGSTRPGGG